MTIAVREAATIRHDSAPVDRRDLSVFTRRLCADIGADDYMILDLSPDGGAGAPRIIASNWIYDAIEDVGLSAIRRAAESAVSTYPGAPPRGWHPRALAALLDCKEIAFLADAGCREIFSLKLQAGRRRFHALLSSRLAGAIDDMAASRAQIALCHALSRFESGSDTPDDPLSERERECLFWVSEGKTTEEVALILDVSSNTINSYVAHAIHKLAASNRAKAIATAIRRGII